MIMKQNIKENYPLKELTTFKIGGPARYFAIANNKNDLIEYLIFAKKNQLKIFIIGGGSNLLIADQGFDGLVIKINFNFIEINGEEIKVSADYLLNQLVGLSVSHGLTGLEFATGIPGTIGGAAVGNAGAYGSEIAEVVDKVEIIDHNGNNKILNKADLNYSYRESKLKHNGFILTYVYLKLIKGDKQKSIEQMNKLALDRWKKHPHLPSAGSSFKNIPLTDEIIKKITNQGLKLPEKFRQYKKIPAAWLIECLDLKGKQIGGAQISTQHANHLVNVGNAKADDVIQLIGLVKTKVRDEFGIQLEEEVRYVGF